MNGITAELAAVAAEVAAAGVPATHDPAMILQLVARHSAAVMVAPPEELRVGVGFAAVDMDVPVWLLTSSPDDLDAADRLYTAAAAAWRAVIPLAAVSRDTYTIGEITVPALRWDTARTVPYPTT